MIQNLTKIGLLCFTCLCPANSFIWAQVYSNKPQHSFKINIGQLFTREILLSYEQGYRNRNASEFFLGYRLLAFYQSKKTFEFFYPVNYEKITALIPYSSGFLGGYTWKHYSKTRKPRVDYFVASQVYARYQFYNDVSIYQKNKMKELNYFANQSLDQYQLGLKLLTGKRFYHYNAFKSNGWTYELYGGIGFRFQYQNKTIFSKKFDTEEQTTVYFQPIFDKKLGFLPSVHFGLSFGTMFCKINTGN